MTETLTDRAWLWIAAALYLGGFVLGTLALARGKRHPRSLMFFIMAAGFVVQTFGLYARGQVVRGCPIGSTFEILQFTTWSATALYFIVGATFRLSLLGYFTAAFATTVSIVSLSVPAWDFARRAGIFGGSSWIEFHAALALFSYGVFALLALTSVMYLLQWFSIKHRQMDGIFHFLPSMRDLDLINLRLLIVGNVLLGGSLAIGSVHWIGRLDAGVNIAMLILGALWILYVIALIMRLANRLVARRLAWACIALFIAALCTLGSVSTHSIQPSEPSAPNAPNTRQP